MKPKKIQRPDFALVNLVYGYKIKPPEWPKLNIHWDDDAFDILPAENIRAIERAFGAESAATSMPRQSSAPDAPSDGNAQKMRDMLVKAHTMLKVCDWSEDVDRDGVALLMHEIESALAAPPRNCDVGTADEQLERFMAFCKNYPRCLKCPCCGIVINGHCELAWAQMPYEKGEAK